jgi:nitrilase
MTKIAIVQQPPVYLNLEKTMARAIDLVREAAGEGCQMVVFPESGWPSPPPYSRR